LIGWGFRANRGEIFSMNLLSIQPEMGLKGTGGKIFLDMKNSPVRIVTDLVIFYI
jgi:hypothetical protein